MTTLYYFMIGAFVVVQAILIVAALFSWIKLEAFYAEITGYTGALILGLNIYLMFTYCRLTGTPYKTRKHFQAVRWIGLIGGYWSLAFGMKFCSVIIGSSLYQFNASDNNQAVYQACLIGLTDFLCVIVPVFLISDTYFIKVFSAKHFEAKVESAPTNQSLSDFGLRQTELAQPLIDGEDPEVQLEIKASG